MKPSETLRTYKKQWFSYGSGYDIWTTEETVECPEFEASLIGSRIKDSKLHLVVLDVDMGVEVRNSKTPGHYHLIFEKPVKWRKYKRVIKTLAKAGVVDEKWARATIAGGVGFIAKRSR